VNAVRNPVEHCGPNGRANAFNKFREEVFYQGQLLTDPSSCERLLPMWTVDCKGSGAVAQLPESG